MTPQDTPAASELPPISMGANIQLGEISMTATATVHSPIPDEHPYFAKIGRVIARMAQFDHVIDIIIWDLTGLDSENASAITSPYQTQKQRFAGLRSHLEARGLLIAFETAVQALQDKARAAARRRNRITHDPWYINMSGDAARLQSQSRHLDFGFNDVSENEFEQILVEVDDLIEQATMLRLAIIDYRSTNQSND